MKELQGCVFNRGMIKWERVCQCWDWHPEKSRKHSLTGYHDKQYKQAVIIQSLRDSACFLIRYNSTITRQSVRVWWYSERNSKQRICVPQTQNVFQWWTPETPEDHPKKWRNLQKFWINMQARPCDHDGKLQEVQNHWLWLFVLYRCNKNYTELRLKVTSFW